MRGGIGAERGEEWRDYHPTPYFTDDEFITSLSWTEPPGVSKSRCKLIKQFFCCAAIVLEALVQPSLRPTQRISAYTRARRAPMASTNTPGTSSAPTGAGNTLPGSTWPSPTGGEYPNPRWTAGERAKEKRYRKIVERTCVLTVA